MSLLRAFRRNDRLRLQPRFHRDGDRDHLNGAILTDDGLVGRLVSPAYESTAIPVMVLHGSAGTLDTTGPLAEVLASKGHVALALQYFSGPGLPADLVEVPLEYVDRGVDFLIEMSGSKRIAVIGTSKGGELALLMGSRRDSIAAVVAVVPSSHVWQGISRSGRPPRKSSWSQGGEPIPFVTFRSLSPTLLIQMLLRRPVALRGVHRLPDHESEAAIPVERIRGPILLVSTTDDRLWPSTMFCEFVQRRLNERGFAYEVTHLRCEGAGHSIGMHHSSLDSTVFEMAGSRLRLNFGGSLQTNADCNQTIWPKIYQFLAELKSVETAS